MKSGQFLGKAVGGLKLPYLAVTEVDYGPDVTLSRHGHERPYLSFVLAGHYDEVVGNRVWSCGINVLRFHPAGEEHTDRFSRFGGRCLNVELETRWLDRYWRDGVDVPLASDEAALPALRLRESLHLPEVDGAIAVEEEVLAMLDATKKAAVLRAATQRTPWLSRLTDFVEARLETSFTLSEAAVELDLHPTHVARAFRTKMGMTFGQYVRRRRVSLAQRVLRTDRSRTVSEIAHETGFADHAHLTRTFVRLIGSSPSRYRLFP